MTYVYRDPERWHPVHEPAIEPAPKPPSPRPTKPIPPKKNPRPLPEPVWGGKLGLQLAAAEVDAWERLHPAHPKKADQP